MSFQFVFGKHAMFLLKLQSDEVGHFNLDPFNSLSAGIPQREAEDHWEHGHGHEAAEPAGYCGEGQAVRPSAGLVSSEDTFVGKLNSSDYIMFINMLK